MGATPRLLLGVSLALLAALGVGTLRTTQGASSQAVESALPPSGLITLPAFQPADRGPGVPRRAQLHTEIPQRPRITVLDYTVQAGDTPWSIAKRFDLQPESILWSNESLSADAGTLVVGRQLLIPPVDGVIHIVRDGDSFERLELLHGIAAEPIVDYPGNGFDPAEAPELEAGRSIIIPGGRSPLAWQEPGPRVLAGLGRRSPGLYSGPLVYFGSGTFQWPVSPVVITQAFWSGHPALDLDTIYRQPVFASDSGTVIFSDWDTTGYGNLIIVDHGNGYWTYYGHNEANLVSVGQGVLQGAQIAESGSSGNSTGDHLDFRIRLEGGGFLDPQGFLP